MTREEAIERLKNYTQYRCGGVDLVALNMAIQALKQMDALDKIRAEIEKERDAWDKWEEADYYYSYDNCLEIIDKYRKEQTDV